MSDLPDEDQLEITRRFLLRFADLMANGSNAANLLLAAQLLEAYANRAVAAEQLARYQMSRAAELELKIVGLSSDENVRLPQSVLRLVRSQFQALSSEFERSGNVISQAMCEASASILDRYIEESLPVGIRPVLSPRESA